MGIWRKIVTYLFLVTKVAFSQTYLVPDAQVQPTWVFPLWFENGDGQRDTLYFCYDPQSQSNGFTVNDSLMGEKLRHYDPTKFNMSFDAPGLNDSTLNKVDVNYSLADDEG